MKLIDTTSVLQPAAERSTDKSSMLPLLLTSPINTPSLVTCEAATRDASNAAAAPDLRQGQCAAYSVAIQRHMLSSGQAPWSIALNKVAGSVCRRREGSPAVFMSKQSFWTNP